MKHMKKVLACLLALVTMMSFVTGCGAPDDAGAGEGKDTLLYAYNGELGNLDPNMRNTNGAILAAQSMFDTLFDPYTAEHAPRVATGYVCSDDGMEYTITLRDDVTFHDGTKVTAKDVKYSIENNAQSPLQATYSTGIAEVTVVDDQTVKVKLESPSGLLIYNLSNIYILPSELHASMTSEAFAEKPIGCGPYKFVSKDVSGEIVMEAYEEYYRGAAAIKNLKGYSYSDDYTRAIALENGEVDIARVGDQNAAVLKDNENFQLLICENNFVEYLILNNNTEPLNNPLVRQAIAYAVNRDMIVQAVVPESGFANSIICAPSMEGYSADVPTYDYNPEKAKQLLAEAGITTPLDLGAFDVMASNATIAEVVQSNLADIGINVTIQQSDVGAFFDLGANGGINIGFFGGGWGGSFGHLADILSATTGTMNWSGYNSAEFDSAIAEAIATADPAERAEGYKKALEIVQTDVPLVNLYGFGYVFGADADLNAEVYVDGNMYFYDMSWKN